MPAAEAVIGPPPADPRAVLVVTPQPPPLALPALPTLAGGAAGHVGFALVAYGLASYGSLPLGGTLAPVPVALVSTQITLAVAHQWLGLYGRPDDLPKACLWAWVRAGKLALGLVPLLAWFATTGDPVIFDHLADAMGLAIGTVTLLGAAGGMRDAIPTNRDTIAATDLLVAAWFVLASAIALLLHSQLG